jgi:pimeloyl-ACP methyl ester carboxylesterase
MAALIPDARFKVIEEAGHMLNWDNTEQFNGEVLAFLERCETMGSWTASPTER